MERLSALLLVMICTTASGGASAQVSASPSDWELKGLKLDMTIEEVKARFPASECKTRAPGIEMCIDKTATFAGGSAHLVTKFLDGQLVSITLNRISIEQTESAGQGLIAKFGAPPPPPERLAAQVHREHGQEPHGDVPDVADRRCCHQCRPDGSVRQQDKDQLRLGQPDVPRQAQFHLVTPSTEP
ncbi:hypothetical protein [Pseudoxanthomonas indica]|uniref:hypothetical protein n=1 Tax=Pseudoxanthomonas indica TaxID=428993 RepID=UPI001115CC4F|nr:hypothetical protein [Pseudoxanthomonas indica]GGD58628.1 hypothetical protein GCM10007235_33660 [Pseudoxanthomonas indica]